MCHGVCFSSFSWPHLLWRVLVVNNIWDFRWEHDRNLYYSSWDSILPHTLPDRNNRKNFDLAKNSRLFWIAFVCSSRSIFYPLCIAKMLISMNSILSSGFLIRLAKESHQLETGERVKSQTAIFITTGLNYTALVNQTSPHSSVLALSNHSIP